MGMAMAGPIGQALTGQAAGAAAPGAMPPPIPGAAAYFIAVGGQQAGPFDLGALQQQAQVGRLTRDTLVWTQGMASWAAAGQVPALTAVLAAVPPPMPPKG
jgi:hypothetical protein